MERNKTVIAEFIVCAATPLEANAMNISCSSDVVVGWLSHDVFNFHGSSPDVTGLNT
jgi:hypothetical protein